MKLLVTGGLGFIGSNFILRLLEKDDIEIVNIDAEYVKVHFSLNYEAPLPGGSLYLFGKFSDWKFKEEDIISIRCANFTAPLVNSVSVDNIDVGNPIVVKKG